MSDLNSPRYEIPIVDIKTGQMHRDWYKYLARIGNSIGSATYSDDARIIDAVDESASEGIGLRALRAAQDAQGLFLYSTDDPVKPQDLSLLAWWPQ